MMLLLKCSKSSALLFFPQLDNLVKMAIVSSATIKGIIWSYCAHYKTHQEPYNIRSMYKHTIPLYGNRVKGRISELSSINKARRFKTVEFNVPDSGGLVGAHVFQRRGCCAVGGALQPHCSLCLSPLSAFLPFL